MTGANDDQDSRAANLDFGGRSHWQSGLRNPWQGPEPAAQAGTGLLSSEVTCADDMLVDGEGLTEMDGSVQPASAANSFPDVGVDRRPDTTARMLSSDVMHADDMPVNGGEL